MLNLDCPMFQRMGHPTENIFLISVIYYGVEDKTTFDKTYGYNNLANL